MSNPILASYLCFALCSLPAMAGVETESQSLTFRVKTTLGYEQIRIEKDAEATYIVEFIHNEEVLGQSAAEAISGATCTFEPELIICLMGCPNESETRACSELMIKGNDSIGYTSYENGQLTLEGLQRI